MTRRLSSEDRRAQLVEAALRLLGEVPLEGLTTRLVAKEVGVSQPALFRHFRSRDALLVAVVEQARTSMGALAARSLEEDDPLAALETLVRGLFDFATAHPGLPRLLFLDLAGRGDAAYHRPLRLVVSMQAALVGELVRKAQTRGSLDANADPERAAFLLTALVQGVLAQWQHGGRARSLDEDAADLIALWTAGVAAGAPARREAAAAVCVPTRQTLATLDVRPLLAQGQDPLTAILSALEAVEAGGVLEVLAPFRPRPLLTLLRSKGHGVADERLDDELVRVTIRRDLTELPLDLRELEAPEPLERVLVLSADLSDGATLLVHLPRVPKLLLPHLAERGLCWSVLESVDGTALLHVRRTDEPHQTDAVSLDQAPPLAIPASFFLTAPLPLIVAGVVIAARGGAVLSSGWDPATLALTHLGTLGFLAMVMVGALYQMVPVVAGARVPLVRIAHVVHALLLLGVGVIAWAGLGGEARLFALGFRLVGCALSLFLLPVGWALLRTPARTDTVNGMRLALLSLTIVGVLGLVMSETLAGRGPVSDRGLWIRVHLALALLCWVGGLISAVSWQVVPMFYLCEEPARRDRKIVTWAVAISALALPACLLIPAAGLARDVTLLAAAPAALAVWGWHPWTTLRAMKTRKRKRPDASLSSWKAGLCFGPLTLILGLAAHLSHDPRLALAFTWLAVWGWAGLLVHGMLHRIVPFLAWFHDLSFLVGRAPVPSTRGLLPDERTRLGLRLHLVSVVAGLAAILTRWDPLAWLAGGAMVATAANMLRCFGGALLRSRRAAEQVSGLLPEEATPLP